MDTGVGWVIPLAQAADCDERWIGGKAAKLAQLARAGFRVPDGFVITTRAYEHLVERQDLTRLIRMELGRKPFASMRWEEIWDVALRIRSAFLAAPIPPASGPGHRRRRRGVGGRQTAWPCGPRRRARIRLSAPSPVCTNRSSASSAQRPCSMRFVWCGPPSGPMRRCSTAKNWPWIRASAAWRSSSRR